MGRVIYLESSVKQHPRTEEILAKLGNHNKIILCENYKEVFNPKKQNFRLQKQAPALILAQKRGQRVLSTPEGFGIGGNQNYYFSYMLNCLYDCRYCFLQGMYPSANHVVFVNYEDFEQDILSKQQLSSPSSPTYFFSGYDCDSLAYDPITGFLDYFLPVFSKLPNAVLELRTKSTNIRPLLKHQAFQNCIVAFSFTPKAMSERIEHGVPSLAKRLDAMQTLAEHGWKIGLRFDPLIYASNFIDHYKTLVDDIFSRINEQAVHSVSVGPLRFPTKMFDKIVSMYPDDPLLAQPLVKRGKNISYPEQDEQAMKQTLLHLLETKISNKIIFECKAI